MRDMTMVTNAQKANGAGNIPLGIPTQDQELAVRARLTQALQMSLDPSEIISLFFHQIQPLVQMSGVLFKSATTKDDARVGRESLHHCDYRLTTDEGYLGEVIFSRSKRFSEDELARIEQLLSLLVYPLRNAVRYQTAMRLALLDPLTLVGNRAALNNSLKRELQLANRQHQQLSLLMIDVDYFKKINDDYGHHRGDLILCDIAKNIQSVCRSTDSIFRYGGEEFVVILSNTNSLGAEIIAERIRQQIANTQIFHNGTGINTTVSIGISTHNGEHNEEMESLFERADRALYRAKQSGRNRTINSTVMPLFHQ
ncbi:GGDEF domain-containing protein [Cellvibrio sp. PSBB023]|jgi:diguanylate cyclase (GGDEF)-like protein|uniref:GGDEF domain-containing protein n=1 Tax=Cellvibrio sp. PSBB023 TaxID=1945512 RepID=UPI0027380C8D|nr:GGDEF domain-containing protein [Cellvibrio sp. PSBB023]